MKESVSLINFQKFKYIQALQQKKQLDVNNTLISMIEKI